MTALGNPELLERMSTMIVETKKLFSKFDTGKAGIVTHEQFKECYRYEIGMLSKQIRLSHTNSIHSDNTSVRRTMRSRT